ncbi:MAG: tRNA 2-thiouridine(34) synthase MnmA [Oligoflexales bacterium]|nr:tRNA 2-thiouridine(34) synthase MnmA [Oligoflexales bacterium]
MDTALLISGGVDSSVALKLLQKTGHERIHAYYLKIWLEDELAFLGSCPWEEDVRYVEAVCRKLNIEFNVVPLQQEYLDTIISYTLRELKAGYTPSPDVFCNRHIKLGAFVDKFKNDFDFVATGHYARVERQDDFTKLMRAADPLKDQTYFLSLISPQQLAKLICPLGTYTKTEVRELANQYDLATKERKDSQGLCFLGKIKYDEFIKFHLGTRSGKIVEKKTGKILGHHDGYWFYTLGQRRGLGLGGGPWYIVDKNINENTIWVAHEADFPKYKNNKFLLRQVNWFSQLDILTLENITCKVRHGIKEYPVRMTPHGEGDYLVKFIEGEDGGIASGQIAVFYYGQECLGGGIMEPVCLQT